MREQKSKVSNKSFIARKLRGSNYGRERGEMPIGPILIIALIVLPLIFLLVTYGGNIAESFKKGTEDVTKANSGASITTKTPSKP